MIRRSALVAVVAVLSSCGRGNDGPLMNPGEDCLACHRLGGEAAEKVYTAAGTVYGSPTAPADAGVAGVTVILFDANQKEVRLVTNAVGNFYTSTALKAPFRAYVERNGTRAAMGSDPTGACASCHTIPGKNNAPGRIYAP